MRGRSAVLNRFSSIAFAVTLLLFSGACATVKSAADRATGREIADRVDRGVRAAADGAENVVLGDDDPATTAGATAEPEGQTGSSASPTQGTETAPMVLATSFDFEPGERVLFSSDFASDNMGDFPRGLDWKRGTLEVVELGGTRFVRASSGNAALSIPLGERLPDRFTIELDIYNPGAPYGLLMSTGQLPQNRNGFSGEPHFQWAAPAYMGHGLIGADGSRLAVVAATQDAQRGYERGPVTARVMVDGQHLKVYWGQERIANVPQVELSRGEAVHLVLAASQSQPIYVGNIRIAAGGRDLYSVLEREGRFTARGVEFDTGSDRLRASSQTVLDEIGAMLVEHRGLELVIEGHTDAEGSAAGNQTLSEARAAAVKAYLVENFDVAAARLESVGYGETRPIASNDTAEGRQENRRVDLVRPGGGGTEASSNTSRAGTQRSRPADVGAGAERTASGSSAATSVTRDDRYTRGTVTVTLDGRTQTFNADGTWSQYQGADNPDWLEFSAEAGSPQRSGNPGVHLYVSYDRNTGEIPGTVQISNNELFEVGQWVFNNYNAGIEGPKVVISTWQEAPNRKRIIQGTYEVKLDDGRLMTGTFDLELPQR